MNFRFAECTIDVERRELCRAGQPVHVEPQVFDLILYLIRNRDRVVGKDQLLEAVWQGRIVSDSALGASPKAGPGYVMSKFGMRGLTQAINAEERGRGIRACAILPGDIATDLLDRRPQPPSAEGRAKMLTADDVADCALLAINLPSRAIVEELLIRPR